MAPWGDAKLLFCILFITCCCTVTLAQIPIDCCLEAKNKEIPKRVVVDYRRQTSGQGCSIDAMILVTRRDLKLCVTVDAPWVNEVVKHVHFLRKHCKKVNHKGQQCSGVSREPTASTV